VHANTTVATKAATLKPLLIHAFSRHITESHGDECVDS
jgi:hypothetical protein